MIYLSTLLLSMFITMALIPLFRTLAVRLDAMDIPGERKIHSYPMPKAGGLAMAMGALIPVLIWSHADQLVQGTLIGAGVVVLFG
ncbi:MAG TPA: undecaprenyl/decaprenyl-phosphate alpha-N-acetylglucosaminyl 1-phosphate transferase, partial [Acidobacteriota bacterium]|nr:undecaprenyl/decaprenyl-phosphate alpha-N-acetylglucosaminyl 1-phosphate transferase [Acidobacteriota bacterium]